MVPVHSWLPPHRNVNFGNFTICSSAMADLWAHMPTQVLEIGKRKAKEWGQGNEQTAFNFASRPTFLCPHSFAFYIEIDVSKHL